MKPKYVCDEINGIEELKESGSISASPFRAATIIDTTDIKVGEKRLHHQKELV